MANRIWGLEFLSRRGSSTLSDEDAPPQTSKRSSSRVQTLCSMRQKSNTTPPASNSASAEVDDSDAAAVTVVRRQSDQDKKKYLNKGDRPHSSNGKASASLDGLDVAHTGDTGSQAAAHDSAYSDIAGDETMYSRSKDTMRSSGGAVDAASIDAANSHRDISPTHDSSTSLTNSNNHSSSSSSNAAAKDAGGSQLVGQLGGVLTANPSTQQQQTAGGGGDAGHQQGAPADKAEPLAGLGVAGDGVAAGVPDHSTSDSAASAAGGNMADLHALLLGELQREAGLDAQQTARAAALLKRLTSNQAGTPQAGNPPQVNAAAQMAQSPTWPPAAAPNPLHIPDNSDALSPLSPTAPGLSPTDFLGAAGFNPLGAAGFGIPGTLRFGEGMLSPGGGGFNSGGLHLSNSMAGMESAQSSAANNLQSGAGSEGTAGGLSGSGFAGLGPAAGAALASLTSPEAVYGTDGLDVPGTAQVAVHNVPFKWCNADLEALFKQLPGYLDAQLLFHENGRSKGVGVGLFREVNVATEACNRLSGVQADGRKLELVLMSPDNHISFSCKQVAVLGLPWEYTAADVCELIEAAAVADGDQPGEAGVDAVEVAYRDDGKSEGRAIATFRTRRQAHLAITRLHGRETLAGLRLRLFYLHEQQQRQHLLSQTPHSLITSVGQLSLDTPSPATAAALAQKENTGGPAHVGQGDGDAAGGSGTGTVAASGSVEEGVLSSRSSFEKDQGPVILHVSGLMESVSREQLRELFSQAGEVTKVDIPDGGRSMGYGFITFSNPQAAEQAMLLFNNYPLGGGAIHVAYSTSATAKARQQALRQARKATLGTTGRASMEGRMSGAGDGAQAARLGAKPSTPRGAGPPGGLGGLGTSLPANRRSLTGGMSFETPSSGLSSFEALLSNVGPNRHSFDHPGFASPQMNMRGTPNGTPGGLFGAAGSTSGKRNSFTNIASGLTPAQLQQLQLLQAAGGPAAAAASAALAAGTAAPFDQTPTLEQLLVQIAAGDPAAAAAAGLRGGLGGPQGFGPPGTPPGGPFGAPSPVGAMNSGGLFSTPRGPGPAAGLFAGQGTPGGMGAGMGFGGLSGAPGTPSGGLFGGPHPAGLGGLGALGPNASLGMPGLPVTSPFGAGLGASGVGGLAGSGQQAGSKSVVVTGMPLGLDESHVIQLFQICGSVQNIHKPADSEVAIVAYDTTDGATRAIQILDGTNMPSGGTLVVRLAPMPSAADQASTLGPLSPGGFGHPGSMMNAGGLGDGSDRQPGEGGPNNWEFVASGVGESNIFAQGSGGPGRGLGFGRGSAIGRPEGGADMFGLGSGGPMNGLWGDAGRPPAPMYPVGMRQGMNRSPSPGASAGLPFGGGMSPAPARQPHMHTASPVPAFNSGDLFARPGAAHGFSSNDGLGFGSASAEQSQSFSQGLGLGGSVQGSASGLVSLDMGEGSAGVMPHMISPLGEADGRIRRGAGSGGSLNAHSVGSGPGSGSDA